MRELKNTFSWSVSRHRIFTECQRAYYYRHYGFWGGWDPESRPDIRELYVLKNLSNRFTLAGRIVHEVVADTINGHRYGRAVTLEEAKATALASLRQGFRESRDGANRQDPKGAVGLFEHEYQEDISDKEWQRIRDRIYRCLDHFFASKIKETILKTGIENWLPVDALDSFDFNGVTVYVAPDFALRNPHGNALVIDWKSGWPSKSEDRTQVVCYGLYAHQKWGVEPRRAIGELHYLLSDTMAIVTLDEAALEEGQNHIQTSIGAMQALLTDVDENTADIERFLQTEDREKCARCNFRGVCWPKWPDTESGKTTENHAELAG